MHENTRPSNPKLKWILAFTIFFFSALGTFVGVMSLVGFAIFVYVVAFCNSTDTLFIMVFTVSFANIFKTSPSAQSLFTYVMLGYVAYKLVMGHSASDEFWLTFFLMVGFSAMQSLMSMNILRTIKFLANFLFIYFALEDVRGHEKDIFLGYTVGVITGSATAWLKILPNLNKYIKSKSIGVNAVYLNRFSGIYDDPNYYVVNVIIALCLIVILFHRKELKAVPFAVISLVLMFFAIMTYSKSAFLMLIIPVLMFLYTNSKNGRYFLQIACFAGLFLFALYTVAGKIDFLSAVIHRLKSAENINQLTTGRFSLWQKYMNHIAKSVLHLFVGNGYGAKFVGGKAAHNTYIDMLYYLGLVGIFLMLRLIYVTAKDFQKKAFVRSFLNYSIIIVMLIMYFFLSELFYFDMPFHILLAIMVFNMDLQRNNFTVRVSA